MPILQEIFPEKIAGHTSEELYRAINRVEPSLIRTQADKAFLPTRCGFSWDMQNASAQELCIKHVSEAEATAIKNIILKSTSDKVYDLSGRKLNKTDRGIYVQEGKKMIRK